MKILVSDNLSEKGVEIFKNTPGIEVEVKTGLKPEELKRIIKNYEGLVVRSSTKATAEIIEAADKLKVIGRAGTGVDNIDKEAATKRGIVVMNTPGGNTITTAEHTVSMLLSLSRNIPQATASLKAGKWEKKKFMGTELFNKTLGIVGLGKIGSVVADRALGLKMKVIAYDPLISPETSSKMGVELVSLGELFSRSDYISPHTPVTPETRGLLGADSFKKMKDGVKILNCARGGIVNEKDLVEAIKSGKVSGAALDVFEKEPPKDNPLLELDEVICTPHLGASTEEAQINVAVAVAEQMIDYLMNGTIRNAVNVPSIDGKLFSVLTPYLTLAERMGSFQSQIITGNLEEIIVEYSGDVLHYDVGPITTYLLKGLLKFLDEDVNFVNAPIIAGERGIKVVETKSSEAEDFISLITLKTKTSSEESLMSGTILGKRDLRIVKFNKFRLEIPPEGHMLLIHSNDRPGVIGTIGMVLGDGKVNVSRMQFGREEREGRSLVVLGTDSPISQLMLEKMKKLPNIILVQQVEL